MHLLYVDESGDDGFPSSFPSSGTPSKVFIRTGLIIHDWKWRRINQAVDEFKYQKGIPKNVELHASCIVRGEKKISIKGRRKAVPNWYGINYPSISDRREIAKDCCRLINSLDVTLICIAIDKTKIQRTSSNFKDIPKNTSWEYLIERYNLYLENANDKVGIIISDASQKTIERRHRAYARGLFEQSFHINEFHFIESILFEPSDSSNLLQLADMASYAFFRHFNESDDSLYKELQGKLMEKNGTVNGVGLKVWP